MVRVARTKSTRTRSYASCCAWLTAFPSFSERTVIYLLLFVNLGLTLFLASQLNIWVDEAYTLHTTAQDTAGALAQALRFELQAPLYFILLSWWRKLHGSIFFARLFSVLCIALTVRVAPAVSRRFLPSLHPGWMVALVAWHPFVIWAAVEMRVYALVILLSGLLLLLFFDGYLATPARPRARLLYLLLSLFALYTHYYLGFLLVAQACVLLALKRWRELFSYVLGMLAVGCCFAPMLLVIHEQRGLLAKSVTPSISLPESLRVIYWRWCEYVLPAEWRPLHFARRWLTLFGFAVAMVILVRESLRRWREALHLATWITPAVMTLFFILSLPLTGTELMYPKHSAALFLPVILLTLVIAASAAGRTGLRIWVLVALFFYLTSLAAVYAPLAKKGDWSRVAIYVMAGEQPGQPILVFRSSGALNLRHYYAGPNVIIPLPRESRFETYDARDEIIQDEQEIARALSQLPAPPEQLWLITDDGCEYSEVNYNCQVLERFVARHYTVAANRSFFKVNVRQLRRTPPP